MSTHQAHTTAAASLALRSACTWVSAQDSTILTPSNRPCYAPDPCAVVRSTTAAAAPAAAGTRQVVTHAYAMTSWCGQSTRQERAAASAAAVVTPSWMAHRVCARTGTARRSQASAQLLEVQPFAAQPCFPLPEPPPLLTRLPPPPPTCLLVTQGMHARHCSRNHQHATVASAGPHTVLPSSCTPHVACT